MFGLFRVPLRSLSLALMACLFFTPCVAPAAPAEPALETLDIVTSSGPHAFQVEVARTPEARAHGLMDRREMAPDHGMLFDFHKEEEVLMWMKNTYLSLDMVFVSKQGRVVSVMRRAKPFSETIISSRKPAYAVIELVGGAADKIGLAVGDSVRHPLFGP